VSLRRQYFALRPGLLAAGPASLNTLLRKRVQNAAAKNKTAAWPLYEVEMSSATAMTINPRPVRHAARPGEDPRNADHLEQQRAERQHGEAFDALVRRARERLYGTAVDAAADAAAVELAKDPDTR
jgi:hypothetical protein